MTVRSLIAVCLGSVLLVACATPTPYQARVNKYGYANQRLEDDRFRVTFSGNSSTSRDVVENYLLYRAAEVTKEAGADWFRVIDEDIESLVRFRSTGGASGFGTFGGFSTFNSFGGGVDGSTARPIPRYNAFATIMVGSGEVPDDTQAYSADEVLTNLGPHIVRPDGAQGL